MTSKATSAARVSRHQTMRSASTANSSSDHATMTRVAEDPAADAVSRVPHASFLWEKARAPPPGRGSPSLRGGEEDPEGDRRVERRRAHADAGRSDGHRGGHASVGTISFDPSDAAG